MTRLRVVTTADPSSLDERQQIRIDSFGMGGAHAMGQAGVGFQRSALEQLDGQPSRVVDGDNLAILRFFGWLGRLHHGVAAEVISSASGSIRNGANGILADKMRMTAQEMAYAGIQPAPAKLSFARST